MKKKSVRLVLVGMCGAAGLLVTPAMRAELGGIRTSYGRSLEKDLEAEERGSP